MTETAEWAGVDDPVVGQLLAAVEDPAVVCDTDGEMRAWNESFREWAGAEAVATATPLAAVLTWAGDDPVARALARRETVTAPARRDGQRSSVTCRPLTRGDAVGCLVTVSTDALEWPVQEAALDAMPDALFALDTDGRIRLVSEQFTEITGIPTDAVTGERFDVFVEFGVVDEAAAERAHEAVETVLAGDSEEVTFVTEPALDDGVVVAENKLSPVRRDGEVVGAVNVVRDVTDRVQATEALEENRERLRTMLETLPVAMGVVDADGRIEHVQGFDLPDGQRSPEEAVGESVEQFADEHEAAVEGCLDALDGQANTVTTTVADRTYEVVFEPVRQDGVVTGTIAVAIDVTDREQRERELAEMNERLDLALQHTDAGVFVWYVDGERVYWHESVAGLFGVEPGNPPTIEEAIDERVHPADRDRVWAALERAVSEGSDLTVEFRIEGLDGETQWAAAEGRVVCEADGPDRLVGTIRDITARKKRENQLVEREQRLRAVIEGSPDPIAMQDLQGHYRVVNEAMVELSGRHRDALRGATPCDVFDADTATRLDAHRREVLEREAAHVVKERIPAADGDRIVQLTVAPHHGSDGSVQGTVTIARDVTELEHKHDELETLAAIQELVQESIRGLTAATTRDEIKATVCDRLAASEFYTAAWVGSRDRPTGEITPNYTAGEADSYLDSVTVTVDTSDHGRGPGGTAYRMGELQVVRDIHEDPDFEPWRETAREHGFESVAAIPLVHGSTVHGVLTVYTDRTESFAERELAGFEVLGEAVGFALSAAQHRRLLESDRILELEVAVDSDDPFHRASVEHGCRFVFENAVQTSDGSVVNYLTVEGADPQVGGDVAASVDSLESACRLDGADGPHWELKWCESVWGYLVEAGARGMRGVVENGRGTIVVEAPGDIDVRRVTDAVRARFGDAELTAKRERDRADATWWQPHGDIGTTLTDRQRGVLQAAYFSGYYEWPRETDAESLADSLDIASTTLLQHLRKGHSRILEAMFDG